MRVKKNPLYFAYSVTRQLQNKRRKSVDSAAARVTPQPAPDTSLKICARPKDLRRCTASGDALIALACTSCYIGARICVCNVLIVPGRYLAQGYTPGGTPHADSGTILMINQYLRMNVKAKARSGRPACINWYDSRS